jgi:hypothetical protein
MSDLPLPLVPEGCNLSDFAFMPLDVRRLLSSETWILGTGDERAAAMCLWLESWHQVPAASLPDDDRMLAHLAKCSRWSKVREHALRGWVKCADGRLYHKVVAEKALEAWIEKLINSFSGASGNSKRWGVDIDVEGIREQLIEAISMLKEIAPQSKTLKKKAVITIAVQSPPESPPDKKTSPPESPPESGWDRNRQGQGQGQGQGFINPSMDTSSHQSNVTDGDDQPQQPGEWFGWFNRRHGTQYDAQSLHDRKKLMTIFTGWHNARVTAQQVNAAVRRALSESTEPIANLAAYVDRVLANSTPRASKPGRTDARETVAQEIWGTQAGDSDHGRTIDHEQTGSTDDSHRPALPAT